MSPWFNMIPGWLALIMLAVAVGGLLGMGWARKVGKTVSFGLPVMYVYIALIVVGILALGGVGNIMPTLTGVFGQVTTATVSPGSPAGVVAAASQLTCVHTATFANNSNVRTSTTRTDEVFVDMDESLETVDETANAIEISSNITCSRAATDLSKGEAFVLVANSPNFFSEIDSSTSNTYNIAELATTPSRVWGTNYQKEVYFSIAAAGISTAASDREVIELALAQDVISDVITVTAEMDLQSYAQEINQSAKDITIYQRTGGLTSGSDRPVFTIHVNKIA